MSIVVVDGSKIAREKFSGELVTVKSGMFGAIATNMSDNFKFKYDDFNEFLGLNSLRWPGGTLAESGRVTKSGKLALTNNASQPYGYGIEFDGLINPLAQLSGYDGLTLYDMIDRAHSKGASLSIIIPTIRYEDDPSKAYNDMKNFLNDLFLNGKYGEFLPEIQLDLGNENYNINNYGNVLAHLLSAIQDFRAINVDANFSIAVQGMHSGSQTMALISNITSAETVMGWSNLLAEIDGVRLHNLRHDLASNAREEDNSPGYWSVRRWMEAIDQARVNAGLLKKEIILNYSAFTANSDDVEQGLVAGLPGAQAFLSLFTAMLELGADFAAAWGVAADRAAATSLSYINDLGFQILTPIGSIYKMMAQNLVGSKLIMTPGLDQARETPYNIYGFTAVDSSTLYVAANDIPNNTQSIEIDLKGFSQINSIYARVLSTKEGISGQAKIEMRPVFYQNGKLTFKLLGDYEIVEIILVHSQKGIDITRYSPFETIFGDPSVHAMKNYGPKVTYDEYGIVTLSFYGVNKSIEVNLQESTLKVAGYTLVIESANVVFGNDLSGEYIGNDKGNKIYGGNAIDLIKGGGGDDFLSGGFGNDTIYGNGGNDTIYGGENSDLIYGGSGGDIIFGDIGSDTIYGGLGNDTIYGNISEDLEFGEYDNDFIYGGEGEDLIYGGDGYDVIYGDEGSDTIYGGNSHDRIYGNAGSDYLFGDDGNDNIFGGGENDTIYGGRGHDLIDGGNGDDNLYGEDGDDILHGGLGSDYLYGGYGNDQLYGGGDRDSIYGGAGADLIDGGSSNDVIYGGRDNDTIYGSAGSDTLYGEDGDDMLYGGVNNDQIFGGSGNDFIWGGAGNDTLTGGSGADIFYYTDPGSIMRILDFNASDGDKIDLSVYLSNSQKTAGDVMSGIRQMGSSVRIDLDNNDRIILENHSFSSVIYDWFVF